MGVAHTPLASQNTPASSTQSGPGEGSGAQAPGGGAPQAFDQFVLAGESLGEETFPFARLDQFGTLEGAQRGHGLAQTAIPERGGQCAFEQVEVHGLFDHVMGRVRSTGPGRCRPPR